MPPRKRKASSPCQRSHNQGRNLLYCFKKKDSFQFTGREAIIFYRLPGQPTRCFICKEFINHDKLVVAAVPQFIFEIQRRKNPRITTHDASKATFCIEGKQRIYNCAVADVSVEGVRLKGQLPLVSKGVYLSPLTLILTLAYSDLEEIVQVTRAKVVWAFGAEDRCDALGIYFAKNDSDQDRLEHYINMRSLEIKLS